MKQKRHGRKAQNWRHLGPEQLRQRHLRHRAEYSKLTENAWNVLWDEYWNCYDPRGEWEDYDDCWPGESFILFDAFDLRQSVSEVVARIDAPPLLSPEWATGRDGGADEISQGRNDIPTLPVDERLAAYVKMALSSQKPALQGQIRESIGDRGNLAVLKSGATGRRQREPDKVLRPIRCAPFCVAKQGESVMNRIRLSEAQVNKLRNAGRAILEQVQATGRATLQHFADAVKYLVWKARIRHASTETPPLLAGPCHEAPRCVWQRNRGLAGGAGGHGGWA